MDIDWTEVFRRALKYLFEGLSVAVASKFLIASAKLDQVLILGLTAAAVFAVLDLYAPAIGGSARLGTGLQIGSSLVGGF